MPPKRKILKTENIISNNDKPKKSKIKKENISLDVPVDKECHSLLESVHVYVEGSNVYDVMLNQTNVQYNNNKFYLIQILKNNKTDSFYVWMRWGRVGKVGQSKLSDFKGDLERAKNCFNEKFYDKTKNQWTNRNNFIKVDGKYDLVYIDYSKKESLKSLKKESKVKLEMVECKLEEKLKDVIRIIFDIKEMNLAVADMKYDSNKVPLGQLNEAQIKAGYKALREIENLLNEGVNNQKALIQACNAYYTRIPHDFGMRVPPLIGSLSEIKRELELMEALIDINIALNLSNGDENFNVHPLDRNYQSLKCKIKPIKSSNKIYKLMKDYLLFTHGSTHTDYELEILDLFEIEKEEELASFEDFGNRMLLWHGSRTTNYAGILSQGLRIAPPEAPISGHMFGKGIYFSDMSSKAANYVRSTKSKNVGFVLLCEVSLGTSKELIKANYRANKLPPNYHSVKGLGKIQPNPETWKTMADGVVVPVGLPVDTGLNEKHKGYLLDYNEYIVYKRSQVKMRFLVKIRFNYK